MVLGLIRFPRYQVQTTRYCPSCTSSLRSTREPGPQNFHSQQSDEPMNDNQRRQPFSAGDLSQIRWASGTNILLGVWLFFAPLFLGYPQLSIRWSDSVAGLVLLVLATLRCLRPVGHFWLGLINAGIGLWLIAAPFVLNCQDITEQLNDMIVGSVVFVAGLISASVRSFNR